MSFTRAAPSRTRQGTRTYKPNDGRRTIRVVPWTRGLRVPEGRSLLDHQPGAIEFALSRNYSYLALDPGLGKTICAAVIAATLAIPAVYICPPFLMPTVQEEFETWAPNLNTTRFPLVYRSADVFIVPDSVIARESVQRMIRRFLEWKGSKRRILFVDEAHRFKNEDAQRSRALYDWISPEFTRVCLLSGTPMPNRPLELWAPISAFAHETIGRVDKFRFAKRYCNPIRVQIGYDKRKNKARWAWDFSGSSNLKELSARVKHPTGPFMYRLRKDVLKLPPKLEELLFIGDDVPARIGRLDRKIVAKLSPRDLMGKELSREVSAERGIDPDEFDLPVATYRRLLGQAKVAPFAAYLKALLDETNEAPLVFTLHKEVARDLAARLAKYKPLVITGDTPVKKRHGIVKAFQTDPRHRFLIANVQAGGVGFTLTRSSRIFLLEPSWVDGENTQAIDRAHRFGQTKHVLAQYVCYRNSMDRKVIEKLLQTRRDSEYL